MSNEINIIVTNGFGHRLREPYVQMLCHAKDFMTQMSPADARDLAMSLLFAAEAAEGDAFLMSFAMQGIGLDEQASAKIMFAFREWKRQHDPDILPWEGDAP